ncbi:MAG: HD domain-containing protein [Patescibacteria group bacterium]|jgi:GTP pyrophosphokinase
MISLDSLKQILKQNYPEADLAPVDKAYALAAERLAGVKRGSMDYFNHPVETALIVAQMKLGPETVIAALLHDLPARAGYSLADVGRDFGSEIGATIKSLEDLGGIERRYRGTDKYVESAKKMFMAVAKDFRVLLIKFAERLNNLQHLETFSPARQRILVEATEKIFVPIAGILGIWHLRWQMEDICFKFREPELYQKIYHKIEKGYHHRRQAIVSQVSKQILKRAKTYGINCQLSARFKHISSIRRKMEEKKVRFNEIYDVFAVRVVTDKIENCYLLLGVIHGLWRPVPRRVKDYIAAPKPNSYQSLHTTVFSSDGHPMEFQIRTEEMHDEAQYGVAAHWYYKRSFGGKKIPEWIKDVMAARKIYESSNRLAEKINLNVLTDDIFCYTPKGDIVELPRGATPIDFAYAVHSELGHYCRGAIINDLVAPLETTLKNNDVVEIIKGEKRQPLKKYLKLVKTEKAKDSIRIFYRDL